MKLIVENTVTGLHKNTETVSIETVSIETHSHSFELPVGGNLLDALLETGHALDYQCRGGYCGACRIETLHGAVDYDDAPLAHLNDDEILPCCCRVTQPLKLAILQTNQADSQGNLFD